jgi:alpha-glucosidase
VLPDAPEEYIKKADLFSFIEKLPDTYDEMRVLDGDIDSFITVARRAGEKWYVGSLTNRDPRTLKIPLTFLPAGKSYRAYIGEDAEDTHYLDNKETYRVRTEEVNAGSVITARLAPGGGFVMRLEPLN